jgi:adenine-specific DNA-methyltransferase
MAPLPRKIESPPLPSENGSADLASFVPDAVGRRKGTTSTDRAVQGRFMFEQEPDTTARSVSTGTTRKQRGAYYTPDEVVRTLIRWVVRLPQDRLLDPACGDGRFIAAHRNSVGIEQDASAAREAISRAPWALVHEGDFFAWAANTRERFECACGNPPFIRYQTFSGDVRARALRLCSRLGVHFTGLASSWAPFIAATAGLLKRGGRLAFVVPAEIGHAPYAVPLLEYLLQNFAMVHVVALRDKLFPALSEDCWILYADGFGEKTDEIRFTVAAGFGEYVSRSSPFVTVPMREWREAWNCRLRPYLMPPLARDLYRHITSHPGTRRLGEIATVGIGYVTGANGFFHLRPSTAERQGIPSGFLCPTVRNGRILPRLRLTNEVVDEWRASDEPMLLLRIPKDVDLPPPVRRYLESDAGYAARQAYKCRARDPWYTVPDVQTPDFLLTYMSGQSANLVHNAARCTCTNSVHGVRLKQRIDASHLLHLWQSSCVKLSCEVEGHPLGGGMLKLEPGEAARIALPPPGLLRQPDTAPIEEGLRAMREWRHYAPDA